MKEEKQEQEQEQEEPTTTRGVTDDDDDDEEEDPKEKQQQRRRRKRKRKRKGKTVEDGGVDVTTIEKGKEKEKEQQQQSSSSSSSSNRTVYVEGIPYSSSREEIESLLKDEHGINDIIDIRLAKWQDSGRLRGYGHIDFVSDQSVQKVLNLSKEQCYIQNRYLTFQQSMDNKRNTTTTTTNTTTTPCCTILLKNLDYGAKEDDIEQIMSTFGSIVSPGGVRIARNYKTNVSKGFAYVEYKSIESAKQAMETAVSSSGIRILGRLCQLDYDNAQGRIKGSFKTSSGRLWSKEHNYTANHTKRLKKNH